MSTQSDGSLNRTIRFPQATAMVVGTIIGASIFVQPSEITGAVPSFSGAAIVWILAGMLTLAGALVAAELSSMFPESGGVYVYLRESFGPVFGFLWGWAMFWTMHTGIIAAIAMVVATYLGFVVNLTMTGQRVVAISAILGLSWVNYLGVRHGTVLQTAFTVVKVGAIVLMVAMGFALGGMDAPDPLVSASTGLLGGGGASGLFSGLAAGLFAFGGWHMVTYNAEETVDPRSTIPRALFWGVLIVTACYLALNAVYFFVLPLEAVIGSGRIAADAAEAVMGFGAGATMTGLVIFSTFGALAGIILAGPRVYYAMARDGHVFAWVGGLHPVRRTPHRAILLQAIWACVLVWTGSYRQLFTRVVYTEWIFFGMMALGLMILRGRGQVRDYSVPGFPLVPVGFALAAFAVVVHAVLSNPVESAQGLGLVAMGAPVFFIWSRFRGEPSALGANE
jgi:basic amino acid/polyamine antiporter, APA family